MHTWVNHAEDRLEAAMEEREEEHEFEFGPVPTGFEPNQERLPHFNIPVGAGLCLPAAFIRCNTLTYKKAWGVTGRFGRDEPQYAFEIFANPVNNVGAPSTPLHLWFIRLLQGRTSNYKFVCNAAIDLGDWGLIADITRYWEYEDQLRKINASISAMCAEAEALDALQESCRNRLAATKASSCLARIESTCQGKDCRFAMKRDDTILPSNRRNHGRGHPT